MSESFLPQPNYELITKHFLEELKRAARGEASSISFLTHHLPQSPLITTKTESIIQGIVIGGTKYITETQKYIPGKKPQILQQTTGILPILKDKKTFITFLQEHIDQQATALGINFGFPLIPTIGPHGELDGTLERGTKEHLFTDVVGKQIGDIARETIKRDIPVTVANDTICLTLAGDGTEDGALIAGTGFNIGIKQQEADEIRIINLESGNFDKFPSTEILTMIDDRSDMPGKQLFEKVISGKYLAEYFNIKAANLAIPHKQCATSQDLSRLSQETNDDAANQLARAILERSAKLVACSLAGVYYFFDTKKALTFMGEGSLLWKGWEYTTTIQKQLKQLGIAPQSITIKHQKRSSIHGALGLLTK